MIRSIPWLVLGLLWGVAHSQPATFDTLYTQGHIGYALMPNSQGYAIAGNHHNGDFWLFQINEQGQIQWEQTYGRRYGMSDVAFMQDAEQATDGSYFLVGSSFAIPDTNWGKFFGYVVKVDAQGNQIWDYMAYTSYDSSRRSEFYNVTPTPDGGCLLSGNIFMGYSDTIDAPTRFWIVKLDSLGSVEFEKIYHNGPANVAYDDGTSDGLVLPHGQGYLIGTTYGFGRKGYLMRLDVNGDTMYTQTFVSPEAEPGDPHNIRTIESLGDRTFIAAGIRVLIKVDENGNVFWSDYQEEAFDNLVSGESYLFGCNSAKIFQMDTSGTILWEHHYPDYGFDPVDFIRFVEIIPAQDGGLLILYNNLSGLGLMKTDCEGNLVNPVVCAATSVAGPLFEPLKVYPNPSSGSFTIDLNPRYPYSLIITDMAGRILLRQTTRNQIQYQWNAKPYSAGMYMLHIKNETTGQTQYLKMLKQGRE